MSMKLYEESDIQNLANIIREKNGTSETYTISQMDNAVEGLNNFSGDYNDLTNKPTLGTASPKDVASSGDASATQVVMGNDSRLTDRRGSTWGQINGTLSNQTDLNNSINSLQGQIDTFTALTDGSTTGDAELTNIRVDSTGHTYPTAGDAVRAIDSQVNAMKTGFDGVTYSSPAAMVQGEDEKLSNVTDYTTRLFWDDGYYITKNAAGTGIYRAALNSVSNCQIKVKPGDIYHLETTGLSSGAKAYIVADANGLILDISTEGSSAKFVGDVVISAGTAAYMYVNTQVSLKSEVVIYLKNAYGATNYLDSNKSNKYYTSNESVNFTKESGVMAGNGNITQIGAHATYTITTEKKLSITGRTYSSDLFPLYMLFDGTTLKYHYPHETNKFYTDLIIDIPAGVNKIVVNGDDTVSISSVKELTVKAVADECYINYSNMAFAFDGDSITDEHSVNQFPYYCQQILGFKTKQNVGVASGRYASRVVTFNGVDYYPQHYTDSDFAGYGSTTPTDATSAQKLANNCAQVHFEQLKYEIDNGDYPIPDVYVLSFGTNDDQPTEQQVETAINSILEPLADVDRSNMAGGMVGVIRDIMTNYPKAKIFVCTPLHRNDNAFHRPKVIQNAEIIRNIAGIFSYPVVDCMTKSGFNWITVSTLTSDGLHPNDAGRKKQGAFVAHEINKLYVKE